MRALALIALCACYDPSLQDCTLHCTGSGDCATGETCSVGLCVAEGGSCGPDSTQLELTVDGNGHVVLDDARTCDASCSFSIASGVTHRLVAVPDGDKAFMGWMGACNGAMTACTIVPAGNAMVGARFDK